MKQVQYQFIKGKVTRYDGKFKMTGGTNHILDAPRQVVYRHTAVALEAFTITNGTGYIPASRRKTGEPDYQDVVLEKDEKFVIWN